MKSVLLCTDGSAYAQASYEYVAWIAQRMPIEVKVLYVTDVRSEKAIPTPDYSASIGIDSYQSLLDRLVELEREVARINHQRAKTILQTAREFFIERGISADAIELIHDTGFLIDCFDRHEAACDLIVLGKRGETASFASEHLGSNLERLVRSSHKPCWVTPREFQPISKVLFAYDGGTSCRQALKFAIETPLLFRHTELHILSVATKPKQEERVQKMLENVASAIESAGFTTIPVMLTGDPDSIIVEYAETHAIDTILMGAYGHQPIRRLLIGSTTTQVLQRVSLPVLLYRQ